MRVSVFVRVFSVRKLTSWPEGDPFKNALSHIKPHIQDRTGYLWACVNLLIFLSQCFKVWQRTWSSIFGIHLTKHTYDKERLLSVKLSSKIELNVFINIQGQHWSADVQQWLPTFKIKSKKINLQLHFFFLLIKCYVRMWVWCNGYRRRKFTWQPEF